MLIVSFIWRTERLWLELLRKSSGFRRLRPPDLLKYPDRHICRCNVRFGIYVANNVKLNWASSGWGAGEWGGGWGTEEGCWARSRNETISTTSVLQLLYWLPNKIKVINNSNFVDQEQLSYISFQYLNVVYGRCRLFETNVTRKSHYVKRREFKVLSVTPDLLRQHHFYQMLRINFFSKTLQALIKTWLFFSTVPHGYKYVNWCLVKIWWRLPIWRSGIPKYYIIPDLRNQEIRN